MLYRWRGPDVIEGEYEVVEERDAEDVFYRNRRGRYVELDPYPPYVTYSILAANVVIWLMMSFTGMMWGLDLSHQLVLFGAKVNWLIAQGEWWRLFTAMFLHIGIMHLFFNSYALFIYGPVVEKLFGKGKFLIVYILSGLMGSLFSYVLSPNPAAGASGAIFGLMGSLLYFRQRNRYVFQRVFGPGLIIIIAINLLYGFIQPGIDNWGHIGGLAGGALAGKALGLYKEKILSKDKVFIWIVIIAIFLGGLWYGQQKYTREIYLQRTINALQRGDIGEAERYADRLIVHMKNDEDLKQVLDAVYLTKAKISLESGETGEAIEAIGKLIEYYPEDIRYLLFRAEIYEQQEDFERALCDYLAAADIKDDVPEIWYRAGRVAYSLGKLTDARAYLNRALKLAPDMEEVKELLDALDSVI